MRSSLCVLLLSVFFFRPVLAASQQPMLIFVSVPPQRYLVERIGGEHVRVRVLLADGSTPETFEPSARQLEAMAEARVYFLIGVPFESAWLDTLQDLYPQTKFIPCCDAILEEEEQNLDPHVWTSPLKAVQLARMVYETLVKEDPERKDEYTRNLEQLRADLYELDSYARERFSSRRTNHFLTAHASWGHLAQDYGLNELSVEKNGREIGPRGLAALLETAGRERIRTLLIQPRHGSPAARTLAAQLNAEVISLDPLAGDYLVNMTSVIDRIARAVQ